MITHIAGMHDVIADAISRFQMQRFRSLAPDANPLPDPIRVFPTPSSGPMPVLRCGTIYSSCLPISAQIILRDLPTHQPPQYVPYTVISTLYLQPADLAHSSWVVELLPFPEFM